MRLFQLPYEQVLQELFHQLREELRRRLAHQHGKLKTFFSTAKILNHNIPQRWFFFSGSNFKFEDMLNSTQPSHLYICAIEIGLLANFRVSFTSAVSTLNAHHHQFQLYTKSVL